MSDPVISGLITPAGNALIAQTGEWLIIEQFPPPPTPPTPPSPLGRFRFLKDHFINGEYILAGEIRDVIGPWTPTADVEPLDTEATNVFYAQGPRLGACIRTQFTTNYIYAPATFWRQVSPNMWGLSGLGQALAPIPAIIGRLEDKAP